MIGLNHYLVVAAVLFCFGLFGVITRRNAVAVLMGVELILNAANINFVAFSRFVTGDLSGQLIAIFVIILAVSEAAVALAIILALYRIVRGINVDEADSLRW